MGRRTWTLAGVGRPANPPPDYNHRVPSPGAWSRALTDLDRVIAPAVAGVRERIEREAA